MDNIGLHIYDKQGKPLIQISGYFAKILGYIDVPKDFKGIGTLSPLLPIDFVLYRDNLLFVAVPQDVNANTSYPLILDTSNDNQCKYWFLNDNSEQEVFEIENIEKYEKVAYRIYWGVV